MKSAVLSVLFVIMASSISSAAFLASVEFLGFSRGGSYAAIEQYWIADGSGFPGAEIVVLSVPDNSIIRRFELSWTEGMMYIDGVEIGYGNNLNPARDTLHKEALSYLDSLEISLENEGIHCICHPLTDTDAEPESVSFMTWVGSLMYRGPEYRLSILSHKEMPDSPPDWLSMFDMPVLLEVLITDSNGNTVMHFHDDLPQPGYEYVSNYRIRDVYIFKDSLVAIIMNTTGPGFEGPDGMFRMVTGVIGH
jgi:hypothetical protein